MNATIIIARCTRNGVTSWQNVAAQLGRSVDSVRAQYDESYLRAYAWAPSREPQPEMVPDPEDLLEPTDTSSPYVKGPGVKALILTALERHCMSSEELSNLLCSPRNSIRARLDRLFDDGKVYHDGQYPRTWGLIVDGKPKRYVSPEGGVAIGFNAQVHQRYSTREAMMVATGGRVSSGRRRE